MEQDILDALNSLHEQATKERSHYYVARTAERAIAEITELREALRHIADFEQDIYVKDADAISYMRNTAKAALGR